MLIPSNITRQSGWRRGNIPLCLALSVFALAAADSLSQDIPANAQPVKLAAALVDRSDAAIGFTLVEQWVKAGEISNNTTDIQVTGVSGVKVTLRLFGRRVGEGEITGIDYQQPTNLAANLAQATQQAIDDYGRIYRQAVRQAIARDDTDNNQVYDVAEGLSDLTVDLQIALELQNLDINQQKDDINICKQFTPGYHGLRLIDNSTDVTRDAWIWPGSALASNFSPRNQVLFLMQRVGLKRPGIEVKRVGDRMVEVYRGPLELPPLPPATRLQTFAVLHFVRPALNQPVIQLFAGQELLPPMPVGTRTVEAIGRRLTENLLHRIRPNGELAGTFKPTKNVYEPTTSDLQDIALAAYSLGRRAAVLRRINGDEQQMFDALDGARSLLDYLMVRMTEIDGADESSMKTKALCLLTIARSPGMGRYRTWRDELIGQLVADKKLFGQLPAVGMLAGQPLPDETLACSAAALAAVYDITRNQQLARAAELLQARLAAMADRQSSLNESKTLLWLSIAKHHWVGQDNNDQRQQVNLILENGVKHLTEIQVRRVDDEPWTAILGGYLLDGDQAGNYCSIDWQSAWATAICSAVVSDPQIVSAENRADTLLSCAFGARFIGQLMFTQSGNYYTQSQNDTLGAIRQSMWDNQLTVEAQAAGLLAITELQNSVSTLAEEM